MKIKLLLFLIPLVLAANDSILVKVSQRKCRFLETVQIGLPPPPPISVFRQEIPDLLAMTKERNAQDNILTNREVNLAVDDLLAHGGVTFIKRPLTFKLAHDATRDALILSVRKQLLYKIPSPFSLGKFAPSIEDGTVYSYPSSFACNTQLTLYILELCSGKPVASVKNASERMIARRLVGGLEYSAGINAGRLFAYEIVRNLLQNDDFKAMLALAKGEWR